MVPEHTTVYDTLVSGIIQQICLDSLVSYVRVLSGEDTAIVGGSKVLLRERGSQVGGDLAADYLKQTLASYNLEVFDQKFSTTGRNIYGKRMGYLFPEKEYIICAHYDAVDAYCADDNASGVAAALEAARVLAQYDPKYTVVYAFWDEEEQGLVGSEYYASQVSPDQKQIQGVIDIDMIGWHANGDNLADIHTSSTANYSDLATLLVVVDYLYDLPVQPVIYNPGTWQSDHSVFWNHGWGAVLLIEAYYGGDLDPFYHGPDDRIARFHLPYFHGMSKLSTGAWQRCSSWQQASPDAVQIGLIASERQAINAFLRSLATEDERFQPLADRYWVARGGSSTDGGAFRFAYYPETRRAKGRWATGMR